MFTEPGCRSPLFCKVSTKNVTNSHFHFLQTFFILFYLLTMCLRIFQDIGLRNHFRRTKSIDFRLKREKRRTPKQNVRNRHIHQSGNSENMHSVFGALLGLQNSLSVIFMDTRRIVRCLPSLVAGLRYFAK